MLVCAMSSGIETVAVRRHVRLVLEINLTEKAEKVFATVDFTRLLTSQVISGLLRAGQNVVELFALKSVQEETTEALVEILLQACDDLFENVALSTALVACCEGMILVLIKNDAGRLT